MRNFILKPAGVVLCTLGLLMVMPRANTALMLEIVDTIPGTFTDISVDGVDATELVGIGDDEAVDIPTMVSNRVFGTGAVRVGSNGGVRFDRTIPDGEELEPNFTAIPIPSDDAFDGNQTLLPFWEDFDPTLGGKIFWKEIADILIIQWNEVRFYDSDPSDIATFQIKVFGLESPALAQFIYADIMGDFALNTLPTIGYQDGKAGFNDVEWSSDGAKKVSNGDVLSLVAIPVPEPTTLALMGLGLAGIGYRWHRGKKAG